MITVLRAPPFATVQDLGRPDHLAAAVPRAGALDSQSLAAGNLLVGNPRGAAGLEWGLGGGTLRFERASTIALTGARPAATLGGRPLEPLRACAARAGDELVVQQIEEGAWLYVAVSGGIDVPLVLGSRSTYLQGRFGGLGGRILRSGDQLPIGKDHGQPRESEPAELARGSLVAPIRLLPGPDRGLVPRAWDTILATEFRVSRAVSRMGYRLHSVPGQLSPPAGLPSAPACIGTLQLPSGGDPIVLLCEGPTVGGYARIGAVATVDLGAFAQRKPGDPVRFVAADVQQATDALRARTALLDRLERGA